MLKAVIFDMDGLLIDSEPLWKEAEKKFFGSVGLDLTMQMMRQTTGLKVIEVVRYWYQRFPWNLNKGSLDGIAHAITDEMVSLLRKKGEGKKGYLSIMEYMQRKNYKIAINSASDYRLIDTVIERLSLQSYIHAIHSGEDEKYGKPHPGGYISAYQKLGLDPSECLVFEDSLNGVLSAKSAGMKCVAVPEEENRLNPKFAIADCMLGSLDEFNDEVLYSLEN